MSDLHKKLCVFGCDPYSLRSVPLHRFPNPNKKPELFTAWVSTVGEKLIGMVPWKIYTNKRVCDYHFKPHEKTSSHRVIWNAVPSVFICMVQSESIIFDMEHNYCLPKSKFGAPTSMRTPKVEIFPFTTAESVCPEEHTSQFNKGMVQSKSLIVDIEHDFCLPKINFGLISTNIPTPTIEMSSSTSVETVSHQGHQKHVAEQKKDARKFQNKLRRLKNTKVLKSLPKVGAQYDRVCKTFYSNAILGNREKSKRAKI